MQWHACQQESGRHQDIIWWHIMLNFREGKKQVDWLTIKEGSTMLARMTRDIYYRKKRFHICRCIIHFSEAEDKWGQGGKRRQQRESEAERKKKKKELQIRTVIENSMCPDVQSPQEWGSRSKEWKEFHIIMIFFLSDWTVRTTRKGWSHYALLLVK